MIAEEYIMSLSDKDLIIAYIECIITGALTGEEFEDFDIFILHKQYEDVKDEIDAFVEQARDRALVPYKIKTEDDLMKCYNELFGDDWEESSEHLMIWNDPWGQFYSALDEIGRWAEYNGYYFVAGAW